MKISKTRSKVSKQFIHFYLTCTLVNDKLLLVLPSGHCLAVVQMNYIESTICDLLPQKQAELAHSGFALAAKTFSWGSLRQTCDFSGTGLYDI